MGRGGREGVTPLLTRETLIGEAVAIADQILSRAIYGP